LLHQKAWIYTVGWEVLCVIIVQALNFGVMMCCPVVFKFSFVCCVSTQFGSK